LSYLSKGEITRHPKRVGEADVSSVRTFYESFPGTIKWQLYILHPRQWVLSLKYYAKPTGQRPVGLPEENGTTFFDQTGPIKRNASLIVSRIFYISVFST